MTPAQLTITANNQTKVYGNNFSFAGTEFKSAGLVNGDLVTNVALSSAGSAATASVGASPYAITASTPTGTNGFVASNYNISYVNGSLAVTPAPLTITANNQTKVYGSNFSFTGTEFTTNGTLANNQTLSTATLSSSGQAANASVLGGPYTITVANVTGGNGLPVPPTP